MMIIKNYKQLIKGSGSRKKALQIIEAGLDAVNTEEVMDDKVKLNKNILSIKNYRDKTTKLNLKNYKRIVVIGFGKASSLMAKHIEKILKNRIDSGIIISTKKVKLSKINVIKGTHPMPTEGNVTAAKKLVSLIKGMDKDDLVLCLISGGGSALLCCPKVPFNRYMRTINRHFASGIDIKKLNKLRKSLSIVKGGKLAGLTKARVVSLIFSDVVGDDLSTIASGPTVGKGLKNAINILLLNNEVALEAMEKKAKSLSLKPLILTNKLKGEAESVGRNMVKKIKNKKNTAILFAGETTVTVTGKGLGGRNQELCLAAIADISKIKKTALVSVGSDGMDGPTDAAGAIVDTNSLERISKLNLDYRKYLKNNDSYHFFKKTKDLIFTGLTGSNVADMGLIVRDQ